MVADEHVGADLVLKPVLSLAVFLVQDPILTVVPIGRLESVIWFKLLFWFRGACLIMVWSFPHSLRYGSILNAF